MNINSQNTKATPAKAPTCMCEPPIAAQQLPMRWGATPQGDHITVLQSQHIRRNINDVLAPDGGRAVFIKRILIYR